MKANSQKLLFTIVCLLCSIGVYAHDFEVDGIYYNILSSTEVEVTFRGGYYGRYDEYTGSIVIPESATYSGVKYSVTSIGDDAFNGCIGLTKVTIPNSVTLIGNYAFAYCTGLTEVTIPNSVTSIGDWAFAYCKGLKEVTIGNSVTSIGNRAFLYCSGLTKVTIGNSVTEIGDYAFSDCTGLTEITIPNSVTSIGNYAFAFCKGLTEVTIPNSVTSIGNSAFRYCSGLTKVTIGNSVTEIGDYAFEDCYGLTEITIPNSVTWIGDGAFFNCSGLTKVTIGDSVTEIGDYAFSGCIGLTEVTIPNSVASIGSGAFSDCTGLTEITIPESVTSIGVSAFHNTPFNTNLPDGVIYLGKVLYCYKGEMPSNTKIEIRNDIVSINDSAFSGCTGLTEITIPNSVTSIGNYAFYGCTGLTTIYCHATTPPTISSDSFSDYSATLYVPVESMDAYRTANYWEYFNINKYFVDGLYYNILSTTDVEVTDKDSDNNSYSGEINIPETIEIEGITYNVTSIDHGAFFECGELTSITIPNRITSIGDNVFFGCTGLTEVVIPTSVTSLGQATFCNCTGLTKITIPNSLTSIPNHAFYGCTSLSEIAIPNSVTSIGNYAFDECTGLTEVTIGNSVTSMGDYAFYNCSGLTEIHSLATTPPKIFSNTFGNYSARLYIPIESIDDYKSADYWEYFTNIRIIKVLAESIELDKTNITAIAGETVVLTATIYPEDATEKGVVWSVSDESIVTIESIDGLNATIKILQAGVATITVETIDGSYLTATCEIDAVSAINQTMSDTANAEYYTIDGLKLAKKPSRGIYIIKQGNTVRKVVL